MKEGFRGLCSAGSPDECEFSDQGVRVDLRNSVKNADNQEIKVPGFTKKRRMLAVICG
jgi:hypothetical protein